LTIHKPSVPQAENTHAARRIPKIALVGCGAIAERYHLPALRDNKQLLDNLILVDPDPARAETLAQRYGAAHTARDYREVLDRVDGAIVAVPHHMHGPISIDFLAHGVHVLCEKPLAESAAEAKQMVAQAQHAGVTLAVNHTRRYFPIYQTIKTMIAEGALGQLKSIDYVEGWPFHWPTTSGFYFKKASPAGVLLDKGAHGVDAICWWLDGKPTVICSQNDSYGGMEGTARIQLHHDACSITMHFSWLAKLQSGFTIVGEEGTLQGEIERWNGVRLISRTGKTKTIKVRTDETTYNDFGRKVIRNFVDVIRGDTEPVVPAKSVIPSIEVIEECYRRATRLSMPWMQWLPSTNRVGNAHAR